MELKKQTRVGGMLDQHQGPNVTSLDSTLIQSIQKIGSFSENDSRRASMEFKTRNARKQSND